MIVTKYRLAIVILIIGLLALNACSAGRRGNRLSIDPFVALQSNKNITGQIGKENEEELYREKLKIGVRVKFDLLWFLAASAEVSRTKEDYQMKAYKASDEFGEIDYEKDLKVDKSNQDLKVRLNNERQMVRLGVNLHFRLWRMLKAFVKTGVQATRTLASATMDGGEKTSYQSPITYDPYAGAGFEVRMGARLKAGAHYDFTFYKFPKPKPFTREVGVYFGVNL